MSEPIRDIGNTTEALESLPFGEKVLWCRQPIVAHARQMGMTLIEYFEYTTGKCFHDGFWLWSRGGGIGLKKTLADSRIKFDAEAVQRRAFWEKSLDESAIIVKGECWHDGGWSTSLNHCLGCSGGVYGIEEIGTGKRWRTNNLWHQGTIPPEFERGDTHRFIDPKECQETKPKAKALPTAEQSAAIRM